MSDARIGSLPNLAAAIGTLPIAKGGTGQVTQQAAIDALLPSQTGNNGKAITTNGTTASWGTISATAAYNFTSQTTTYSAAINDYILCSSSSFTITLPTAVGQTGKSIVIQHGGTSLTQVYTLNTTSGQTINGANGAITTGNYSLYTTGETLTLVSDNANWQILAHQTSTSLTNAGAVYVTSTSAYVFTVTAANATTGAVYSNNGFAYQVTTTITGTTTLTCSGTGTPAASGTLTKVSGTGDATITFSSRTITGAPVKGTVATDQLLWERSGRYAKITFDFNATAAGTTGSGQYVFSLLPAGMSVDPSVLPIYIALNTATGQQVFQPSVGNGFVTTSTNGQYGPWEAIPYSSNTFRMQAVTIGAAPTLTGGIVSGGHSAAFGATSLHYHFEALIPILGWQP